MKLKQMNEAEYKKLPLKEKLELALSDNLSECLREYMLREQWVQTRCYFARREDLSPQEVSALAQDDDHMIRLCIAKRQDLTPEQVAEFVNDPDPNVRYSIARNPMLNKEQRLQLQADNDPLVQRAAAKGPREVQFRQRPGQARLIR